jgi:O-acetyl-ADP-ribose deacetylase (regulator of RNase III)
MKLLKKDITTIERGVLLNGVNCQRVMGAGVAKAYYTKWPQVKSEFLDTAPQLGRMCPVEVVKNELYVANCFTQEFYGRDGRVYADPAAISTCAYKAALFADLKGLEVYTPLIGCGLGGLDASLVEIILEQAEQESGVPFTLCII